MGLEDGGEVDGEGHSRTVVVGVELDSASRTLLTWALCNVAQSGDRVIALHVIDTPTGLCVFSSIFCEMGMIVVNEKLMGFSLLLVLVL